LLAFTLHACSCTLSLYVLMHKQDYRFVNWGVQGPSNVLQGAREGIGGFAHEVVCSIAYIKLMIARIVLSVIMT
jgi:hypothetical protein